MSNELEKSLLTIETGVGRYVSTEDVTYRPPVRRALADYPKRRDALARLLSDDPGQQQRVREIGEAIDDYAKIWVRNIIDIARVDLPAAADQMRTDGGRRRLDAILRNFDRLSRRELAVIRSREALADSNSARAIELGIGGLSMVLVITAASTMYLRGRRRPRRAVSPETPAKAA